MDFWPIDFLLGMLASVCIIGLILFVVCCIIIAITEFIRFFRYK